jgi:proton-coupled amino acid transporter
MSPASHHNTYIAGEEASRLHTAARDMGLSSARQPLRNVRETVAALLHDTTLESARMHSVGALGQDERVDNSGTLHLMTLTRRKRGKHAVDEIPKYGTLQDLFHKEPLEVEEEEEAEEAIDTVEGGSLTAAVFGIIKGTVGPAILYLPRGFQLSGWAVAIPAMMIATASYLYSAYRLLQCWRVEKQKVERLDELRALLEPTRTSSTHLQDTTTEFGSIPAAPEEVANATPATLLTYPELARRAFGAGSVVVQFGIAAMQFGVCLTYLIFVPQNLVESVRALWGWEVDKIVFLVAMVVIEIPLSWIRDIRKLTPTNILATFLIAYGLLSCLMIALSMTLQDLDSNLVERIRLLPATNDTWYLFIGTSVRTVVKHIYYIILYSHSCDVLQEVRLAHFFSSAVFCL